MSYLTMLLIYRYLAQTGRFKPKCDQAASASNIGQYLEQTKRLSTCYSKRNSDKNSLTWEKT